MAQTTGGMSWVDADVEASTDNFGSDVDDFAGYATKLEQSGGNRQSGEAYTMDGDTAIVKRGKREPIELTLDVVYTEGADPAAFEKARAAYEAGTSFNLRWYPASKTSGSFMFTSVGGLITEFTYPQGEAESGDPLVCTIKVKCQSVTKAAYTP